MKLTEITIENYRCFENLHISLHPEVTVLVAANGAGKTTIIDAARIAVWPFVKAFDLGSQTGKSATIQIEDVRLFRQGNNMEAMIPSCVFSAGYWPNSQESSEWKQTRVQLKKGTNTLADSETKRLTDVGKELQIKVRDLGSEIQIDLPLIVYLGTGRLWYQGRHTSEILDKKLDNSVHSRLWGYQNCITASSSYKQFEEWYAWIFKSYREQQILEIEGSNYFDKIVLLGFKAAIDVVKGAVNHLTEHATGWKDLEYSSSQNQQLVMHHPELGTIPLSMLSDGVRNMVVMISDIAFRCIKLNPHHGDQAALLTKGIVMIDEVDMFLHPSWQQSIITSLRNAFPLIQFIVTTHSPQVLSTVPAECIRIIEGGSIYMAPKGSKGAESSRLLKRIFGVDTRPMDDENTKLLLKYEKLVLEDQWASKMASEMRAKLDEIFAGEEPKLTELDLYIENRAWELELEKDQ